MNAQQRQQMQLGTNAPASVSLPGISPAQLRAMAREIENLVLEAMATELESEGTDPLLLVYGGETCSTMSISPRIAAELLLMLERAG